ncbi:MAG: porin family protein [Bacteroidetes bacterium]|nr:porin family protein [Bacteroidota bacterium]
MKKTLLIAASLLIVGMTQAQDNKFWVSGSAQFLNSSDDSDDKLTGGSFSPAVGYSINKTLAVGISLGYDGTKFEQKITGGTSETTTSEFSVFPFFRYYKSVGEKCSVYGEVFGGFGSGKSEFKAGGISAEDTYGFVEAGISPGIQYWFHDNWSVNAVWGALRYRGDNDKGDAQGEEDFKSSDIEVGLNLSSISFGLNFHF